MRSIYIEGIATGNATFEQAAPDWEKWDAAHLRSCRIAAREGGEILGWAALSPVSSRCVYAGVAEVSVYIAAAARGRGIGANLISRLVVDSEAAGLWTLQAGIFPENASAGFRVVGTRERIGPQNGRWCDVVLMERRSATIGK